MHNSINNKWFVYLASPAMSIAHLKVYKFPMQNKELKETFHADGLADGKKLLLVKSKGALLAFY